MAFGPLGTPSDETSDLPRSPPENLRDHVRDAAERLVAELADVERQSDGFQNDPLAFALVESAFDGCLARLTETGLSGRDNQPLSNEFWKVAGPVLECGAMQLRARAKPRGYAGDFELFTWICDGLESSPGMARHFDRYFQQQAAVEAVRSRTDQVAAAIAARVASGGDGPFRVVNVGSGPAIEVERAAKWLSDAQRRRLFVTLLDLDGEALEAARIRLAGLLPDDRLTLVRDNLYRLAGKPRAAAPLADADMLICAGLFDYLPDAPATNLLRLFWRELAPGGILLVGNFAPHCPTRAYMEWIGNWYLIYRTAQELAGLAAAAEIPSSCFRIGAERLGMDLFLCASKPG
jgi:extracellular factor (EF) 3-hydroxypalmitic acid methyl ester biosynthesis protein